MTKIQKIFIAVAYILFLLVPLIAHEAYTKTVPDVASSSPVEIVDVVGEVVPTEKQLPADVEKWLDDLEMCESSGNPNAINPEDLDGTPSYGAFQFKPSTFAMFAKIYGVTGDFMDRDAQRAIVIEMIKDSESINWYHQFPDCVRKLGTPPPLSPTT